MVIVVLGVLIGTGAYVLYKNSTRIFPQTPNEKLAEPVESAKTTIPATEKKVETEGSKQSTKPESTAKPETPSIKGNFSKKGAVAAREDGWTLIWDEPGRMAMNVKLKFTDQSICFLGGEKKDCGLINMGPQSYDFVSIEGDRSDSEVMVIRLEELKLPR